MYKNQVMSESAGEKFKWGLILQMQGQLVTGKYTYVKNKVTTWSAICYKGKFSDDVREVIQCLRYANYNLANFISQLKVY